MQGQHSRERLRLIRESLHHPLPERIAAFEGKHEPGHQSRASRQTPVPRLIWIQSAAREALRQQDRLAECKAETFAGNRIYARRKHRR